MKVAILDVFSGLSGDMMIGAMLSAGLSFEYLKTELEKLELTDYEISYKIVSRKSISAIKFDVKVKEHHHNNLNELHEHGRSYAEIVDLINKSNLSQSVKERSINIFKIIGQAEAKIHNINLNNIHFHEIGAIDSIIDIVGCAIGLEYFGIKKVFTTQVPLGKGFVNTQHGKMPIPAPATIEILKNYPVKFLDLPYELTTPTGAGIIKAESSGLVDYRNIIIEKIGYGAGSYEIEEIPNLFRLIIGEFTEKFEIDESFIIETNIDDMNPEFYPFVLEKLFEVGVHDAYLIPIIMKKGRPGIILSTLCEANKLEEALNVIYRETTTLGVRIIKIDRRKLNRETVYLETRFGKVKVKKVNSSRGEKFIPEYEECKRIALEKNIPISDIYNEIIKLNS